ncbi:MAG TPA: mechanosensitive ion channel domain-containing protein [Candidatus Angelobacter sp.]
MSRASIKIRIPAICRRISTVLAVLAIALAMSGVAQQADPDKPSSPNAEEILSFLNQTIVWSGQLATQRQLVNEPSDAVFLNDNRQVADEIVRLAFDFARARAQAIASQTSASTSGTQTAASQYQRLIDSANQADAKVKQSQTDLDSLRAQLATATGKKRVTIQASIDENQSEMELFQARRDALRNMLQFATGAASGGTNSGNLSAHIEELAHAVPAAASNPKDQADSNSKSANASAAAVAANVSEKKESPNGLLPLATDLFSLKRKLHTLDNNLHQTELLTQNAKNLRTPLVNAIKALTQKGDEVSAQPDSQDPAVLAQQRKDLNAVTAQYKQLSASLLPLGKQNILLDVYSRSTKNWRETVQSQYDAELKGLLLRLGGLGIILAVVYGISALWRRAIFRYVTDVRRRYQFLLIRKIVLWFLIAIIVASAFASELGAVTTFAGLMTAGIAVALQNVILSIAGYFFLIGKYGLRVGDRVQIADVTGDVVDIGLVRMHLMEIAHGSAPLPTGRVVAFSNAVVFQANSGMFKQIPGTSFLWHEITLTLESKSDYRQVEERIMAAVNKVFAEYHDKMEQQRRNVERSLNSTLATFAPESRLHLTQTSLELVVRYPVEMGNAGDIDNKITREILNAIEEDPKLRSQVSGVPSIKTEEQQPAEQIKG